MRYVVIKEYTSYAYGFPLRLPVGLVLEWFKHGNCYTGKAIGGYVPFVQKWATEAWHDYFSVSP